jgi:hypothetical protein
MYYGPAQLKSKGSASVATHGSTTARLSGWINDAAFTDPEAIGDGYGFGNSRRGLLRGPGQNNTDFNVTRELPFHFYGEGQRLEIRAESFNLFNHSQFADPITLRGSGFGQITSTSVMPRLLQLAAKIYF